MDILNSKTFEMKNKTLSFSIEKSILLCKDPIDNKNVWAKKIEDIHLINDIIEDKNNYYLCCENEENSGQFLALNKNNGSTIWFIPGKSFLQQILKDFIYLIFIDIEEKYYLIKVKKENGEKIWFYQVTNDLMEYSIREDRIQLKYESGKVDKISTLTGQRLK